MNTELRELSFGETLGKSFNLLIENFPKLYLAGLVGLAPTFILMTMNMANQSRFSTGGSLATVLITIASYVLNLVVLAILTRFSLDHYLGKKSDVRTVIEDSLGKTGKIIGFTLLAGLVGFAIIFIFSLLGTALFRSSYVTIGITVVLVVFGGIVCTGLACLFPIFVNEDRKIVETVKRSWELTRGEKLKIFGLYFVLVLLVLVAIFFTGMIIGIFRLLFPGGTDLILYPVLSIGVYSLMTPLFSNLAVIIYVNLRIKNEGFAVEHLADQFDMEKESVE